MSDFVHATLLDPATIWGAIAWALAFLAMALALAALIRRGAKQMEQHFSDKTGLRFVSAFAQTLVYVVMFIVYARLVPELRDLGTTMLAGVSIISIVIGLAAQSALGNLVAGFVLVLYRPVRVGDRVELATPRGLTRAVVREISLGYTILIDEEGGEIVAPNSVMANAVVIRLKG